MKTAKQVLNIDQSHLELLAKANAITGATVFGDKEKGWKIRIEWGEDNLQVLNSKRGEERTFAKLETVTHYLCGVGIRHFMVESHIFN